MDAPCTFSEMYSTVLTTTKHSIGFTCYASRFWEPPETIESAENLLVQRKLIGIILPVEEEK